MVPFFQPMVHPFEDGHWYLAEDYAFCERARQCGFKIMADTSIRLWHIGEYAYGWEDAGRDLERFETFTLNLGPEPERRDGPASSGGGRFRRKAAVGPSCREGLLLQNFL